MARIRAVPVPVALGTTREVPALLAPGLRSRLGRGLGGRLSLSPKPWPWLKLRGTDLNDIPYLAQTEPDLNGQGITYGARC